MIQIDIDMPSCCNECPCYYEAESTLMNMCQAKNYEHWTEVKLSLNNICEKRPKWCPLIEVKEGKQK